jgi:hypothetical protein
MPDYKVLGLPMNTHLSDGPHGHGTHMQLTKRQTWQHWMFRIGTMVPMHVGALLTECDLELYR